MNKEDYEYMDIFELLRRKATGTITRDEYNKRLKAKKIENGGEIYQLVR